jgi:hypothetical protein
MRQLNWTTIALIGGLIVLLGLIAYFTTNRNPDQDKLTGNELSEAQAPSPEKACSTQATYDLIKRELFRRAAQLRGSNQAAYDKLAAYAVVRMENPVMESEDSASSAVNCSGSLSLDLPPGVAAVGGRRTLMADLDYTVQPAAGGSSTVVMLRNADAIIAPLATLAKVAPPAPTVPVESKDIAPEQPEANVAASESASLQPGPATSYPGRPSFDCSKAGSKGEIAVCSDSGLSALDVNMAAQYRRALAAASPAQFQLLQTTRNRFLAYRDRCPNRQCIGDAYVARMREIRDIMEGRWQPAR